jgi:hypothetical protein
MKSDGPATERLITAKQAASFQLINGINKVVVAEASYLP